MDNLRATKFNMIKMFRFVLANHRTYYQGGVLETLISKRSTEIF